MIAGKTGDISLKTTDDFKWPEKAEQINRQEGLNNANDANLELGCWCCRVKLAGICWYSKEHTHKLVCAGMCPGLLPFCSSLGPQI